MADSLALAPALDADYSELPANRVKRRKVGVETSLEVLSGCHQERVSVQISIFASGLFHKASEVSTAITCK